MKIKCGNCKEHHDSVADVKACYAKKYAAVGHPAESKPKWEVTFEDVPRPAFDEEAHKRATIRYIREMHGPDGCNCPREYSRCKWAVIFDAKAGYFALGHGGWGWPSEKTVPERQPVRVYGRNGLPLPFPPGRYAINTDDGVKFYKVDSPTEGQWAGYVFVKVQASDELHPIRNQQAAARIINKIAEDPREALLRYGREIGKCGHCGRTLTNRESREYGIGPICRNQVRF